MSFPHLDQQVHLPEHQLGHAGCPPGRAPLRTGRRENRSSELKDPWARAKPDPAFEGGRPSRLKGCLRGPLPAVVSTAVRPRRWSRAPGPVGPRDWLQQGGCIQEQSLPTDAGPARGAAGQGMQSTEWGRAWEPQSTCATARGAAGPPPSAGLPPAPCSGPGVQAGPHSHAPGPPLWVGSLEPPPGLPSSRCSLKRPHHLACPAHRAAAGPAGNPHTDPQAPGMWDGSPGHVGSACPHVSAFWEQHTDGDPGKISCLLDAPGGGSLTSEAAQAPSEPPRG